MVRQSKARTRRERTSALPFPSRFAYSLYKIPARHIEHGHATARSDNYFFRRPIGIKRRPHAAPTALPPVESRVPRLYQVGGPGNAPALTSTNLTRRFY